MAEVIKLGQMFRLRCHHLSLHSLRSAIPHTSWRKSLRQEDGLQVFAKAGLESPVLGSIIVGAVNVVGTAVAAFLMDHAGRRQLLLVSHVIMTACLAGLAISTWLPCKHPIQN